MVGADFSCDDNQMKTDGIVIQNAKVASSICDSPGFGWPCIHFRDDFECLGTSLSSVTHTLLTYDDCAKECIGTPGCIMFNWEYKLSNGSVSQCVLFSSGGFSKRCFDPVNYEVPISLRGFLKAWFWLAERLSVRALSTKNQWENLCSIIVLTKTFNWFRNLWKWFNSIDSKIILFKYLFNWR